jgi:TP901 family phage tail tape measure protein
VAVVIPITTTFDRKGVEQAQAEMAKVSGAVTDTQKKMSKQFKMLGAAVGAAAVGIGVAGTMAFVDFERSMNEVFTLVPGTSQDALDAMTNNVKKFSKEFGVLPEKIVPALYQALSAGVPQDNVFAFLETAQKAAKGGVTDLTTAVNGISSVVNAYGADIINATQASDLMFTAVRMGKTTFEELSNSLFNVTPITSALGVKFADVTAAMSAMTAQGIPTNVASTQLRQLFVELSKEGTKTSEVFEKISGKSFKQFVTEGGNTQQALLLLEQYAKKTGVGINDLFGSVEGGSAALALTGKGTETFSRNLDEMGKSAGATEGAFTQMDQGLGPLIDRFKAWAAVLLIDIGTKLAPIIENIVNWFDKHRVAAYALAGVIGGVLLAALGAYIISAGIAAVETLILAGPFILLAAAIAVVVGAFILFYTKFDEVMNFIKDHPALALLIATIMPVLIPIFAIVAAIKFLQANWDTIWNAIQGAVQWAWSYIEPIWNAIKTFITETLVPVFISLGNKAVEIWNVIKNAIAFAWNDVIKPIWDAIYGFIVNTLIPIFEIWWGVVSTILTYIGEKIQRVWTDIIQPIWNLIYGYITTYLIPYFQLLWNIVSIVWDAISTAISYAWNSIISPAFEKIKSGISTVWGFFQTAKDIISTVFSTIADSISGPFREAFNFIARAWNNTVGKLSWTIPRIVPVFGGDTISAPRLPEFAKGGMFNAMGGGAGLAVLHDNEMILNPQQQKALFSGNGMGGGASVYNINVNVSATADKASIGQTIVEAIASYERRSGSNWRSA